MIAKIYSWILNHKKFVIGICVILIAILIINMMTNNEAEQEEKWLEEQEKKIIEMEMKKEVTKPEPIDHKLLGMKHFHLWDIRKGDVIEHYVKAIEHLEQVIVENADHLQNDISNSAKMKIDSPVDSELFYKLAKLYHIGVNDGYYRNGQKRESFLSFIANPLISSFTAHLGLI